MLWPAVWLCAVLVFVVLATDIDHCFSSGKRNDFKQLQTNKRLPYSS